MTPSEVQGICDKFGIGKLGERYDTISLWRLSKTNPTVETVMDEINGVLKGRERNSTQNLAMIEDTVKRYTVTIEPGTNLYGEEKD